MSLSIDVLGAAVSEGGIHNQSRHFLPERIVNVYMIDFCTHNLKSYKPFPFSSSHWFQGLKFDSGEMG